jgi:hypothetical protein
LRLKSRLMVLGDLLSSPAISLTPNFCLTKLASVTRSSGWSC